MIDQEEYYRGVTERISTMIDAFQTRGGQSLWGLHAILERRKDDSLVDSIVERDLANPSGGPFQVLPAMLLYCRWREALPASARERIRRYFLEGAHVRGNTENHWLMYYVGNALAAQEWPDGGPMWNGLPPAAVHEEAKRWILADIRSTAYNGHFEYDSPVYLAEHVIPMMGLADHSRDPELARQAKNALSLFFLDVALEYFHGAWAGGHCREGYRLNTWTRTGTVMPLHFMYFGGEPFDPDSHCQGFVGPALSSPYRPPAAIVDIAFHGKVPRAVLKTRAPRWIYRHVERPPQPVRKYTWMSRSFALGSTQLGIEAPAGPMDLTAWDLTWEGPRNRAKICCNHPYRSPARYSAFLSERPQLAGRAVALGKPYAQSCDRLFGASPYERMMQHEGSLLLLYRIPADDPDPYANLFLPKGLEWTERSGWLFADLKGFHVGLFPIGAYRWEEIKETGANVNLVTAGDQIDGWLLRILNPCAGLVLEAVEADEAGGYEAWCGRRAALQPDLAQWFPRMGIEGGRRYSQVASTVQPGGIGWPSGDWPPLSLRGAAGRVAVRDTRGRLLELDWDGEHRIDGVPVRYADWPLYGAPGVEAPLGEGRVTVEQDGARVEVDFTGPG